MEKLYTVKEIAAVLKISELTVRRYIKAGRLKSTKINRIHRINELDLISFMSAKEAKNQYEDGFDSGRSERPL